MSGDSKIWHSCQDGMQKLGAIASYPGKWFLLLKFSGSLAQSKDAARHLQGGMVSP